MKSILSKMPPLASLFAVLLAWAGCATAPMVERIVVTEYTQGVPGGTLVETYETSARISAINLATRELTLVAPDGSTNTFCAGPGVLNFERHRVGAAVKVVVARELTMHLDKDAPLAASNIAELVQARPGVEPGVFTADMVQLAATVTALNPQRQEATLKLSDGRTATFKVRKDIDLTQINVGAKGIIRTSAALALLREKP